MKKKKIFLTLIVLAAVFSMTAVLKTKAGLEHSGQGWLWGGTGDGAGNSTGLGWISMNNANPTAGGTVSYGVNIPSADGPLSGYAWSENVGWVSFNESDLSGCPNGACLARRTANNIDGWARIISIKDAAAVGNSGGWQGWIKLSGSNAVNNGKACESGPKVGQTCNVDNDCADVQKCVNSKGSQVCPIDPALPCSSSPSSCSVSYSCAALPDTFVEYGVKIDLDGKNFTQGSYAWSNELGWIDFSLANIAVADAEECISDPEEASYSCITQPAEFCGACSATEKTLSWACIKNDNCGSGTAPQPECLDNGVNSCSDTICPACSLKTNNRWREVAP